MSGTTGRSSTVSTSGISHGRALVFWIRRKLGLIILYIETAAMVLLLFFIWKKIMCITEIQFETCNNTLMKMMKTK